MSSPPQPPDSHEPSDPAVALEHVVADEEVDLEAVQWAADELLAGRDVADLVVEMYGNGWQESAAERIVEIARQQTCEQRGVLTRDAVVRDLNVDYRRATAGMSVAFRSGLFGLYGFTTGVMAAWRTLRKLARLRSRERRAERD
jgi:hypothetical protein